VIRVHFHATLRAVVGQKTVDLPLKEGICVKQLAVEIAHRWPALADRMIDAEGEISRQVHFMIGGRNTRWLADGSATKLFSNDVIEIFPPTAGG
jgi:MoaD family protein